MGCNFYKFKSAELLERQAAATWDAENVSIWPVARPSGCLLTFKRQE